MPYFKKYDPRIKVVISTGESVPFEAVTWEIGVYPPAGKGISEWLAGELRRCIANGVGGMEEITAQEYDDLIKKKQTDPDGLARPSREELQAGFKVVKRQLPPGTVLPPGAAPRVGVDMHNGVATIEVPTASPAAPVAPPAPGTPVVPDIPRPTASKPVKAKK